MLNFIAKSSGMLLVVRSFNVVTARMRKQEEMGVSQVLLIVRSFNMVATRVRKKEELKCEPKGKLPSPPPPPFFRLRKRG